MTISTTCVRPAGIEPKRVTYGLSDAFARSLNDKVKDWVKVARYTAFYVEQCLTKAPASLSEFGRQTGNFKNILSIREFYKEIPGAVSALTTMCVKRSVDATRTAFTSVGRCFNALADTVEVTSVFVPLNAALCASVKRTNVWVTGSCCTLNAAKELDAFLQADHEGRVEQQVLSLLRLAMNVSYLAFATLCIAFTPSALAIVSCLAAGTLFGLASFFYEMLNDPYCKNYEGLMGRVQVA